MKCHKVGNSSLTPSRPGNYFSRCVNIMVLLSPIYTWANHVTSGKAGWTPDYSNQTPHNGNSQVRGCTAPPGEAAYHFWPIINNGAKDCKSSYCNCIAGFQIFVFSLLNSYDHQTPDPLVNSFSIWASSEVMKLMTSWQKTTRWHFFIALHNFNQLGNSSEFISQ